jgi:hypothetical protein
MLIYITFYHCCGSEKIFFGFGSKKFFFGFQFGFGFGYGFGYGFGFFTSGKGHINFLKYQQSFFMKMY